MSARAWLLSIALALDASAQTLPKAPPPTRRDDVREVLHGVEIVDPYRWLEDGSSPETRAWIDAQNALHTGAWTGAPDARRPSAQRLGGPQPLRRPVGARSIAADGISVRSDGRRTTSDPLRARGPRRRGRGAARSPSAQPRPHDRRDRGWTSPRTARVLVYGLRRGGEDETELRVRDVATRTDLPDVAPARPLPRRLAAPRRQRASTTPPRTAGRASASAITPWARRRSRTSEVFGSGYGPEPVDRRPRLGERAALLLTRAARLGPQRGLRAGPGGRRAARAHDRQGRRRALPRRVRGRPADRADGLAGAALAHRRGGPQGPGARAMARDRAPRARTPSRGSSLAGGKLVVHDLHDVASQLAARLARGRGSGSLPLPGRGQRRRVSQARWRRRRALLRLQLVHHSRLDTTARASRTVQVEPWWRPQVPVRLGGVRDEAGLVRVEGRHQGPDVRRPTARAWRSTASARRCSTATAAST